MGVREAGGCPYLFLNNIHILCFSHLHSQTTYLIENNNFLQDKGRLDKHIQRLFQVAVSVQGSSLVENLVLAASVWVTAAMSMVPAMVATAAITEPTLTVAREETLVPSVTLKIPYVDEHCTY